MAHRNVCNLTDANVVRDDVLAVTAYGRRLGHKTMVMLDRIARNAGLLQRRIRTIAMQDQTYVVTHEQRRHLALSIADLHDQLSEEHERAAEDNRLKADMIRHRERQQLSFFGDHKTWRVGTTSSPHSTASPPMRTAA